MRRVGGLVPQKIAIRPGLLEQPVGFIAPLSEGEGDGAVGEGGTNGGNDPAHPLVVVPGVLAALQDEGAEAARVALAAAGQNLLRAQSVAAGVSVVAADAAVDAVILAVIREFHDASDVDGFAEYALGNGAGKRGGVFQVLVCEAAEELRKLIRREHTAARDPVDSFQITQARVPPLHRWFLR